jgi:hypothetical protein
VQIRPDDSVVVFETVDSGRNSHVEMNKPPWKRTQSSANTIDWTGSL